MAGLFANQIKMNAISKKYYLVTYTYQPAKGTPLYPYMSKIYEFDGDKTPLECHNHINEDLNKDSISEDIYKSFRCGISNMVRVE